MANQVEADLTRQTIKIDVQACSICHAITQIVATTASLPGEPWKRQTVVAGDPEAHHDWHTERGG